MSIIRLNKKAQGAQVPTPPSGKVDLSVDFQGNPQVTDEHGVTKGFGSFFGQGVASKKKTEDESTSSTSYTLYDNMLIYDLDPNGKYLALVRYVWGYNSGSTDFRGEIFCNNVQMVDEHRQEPKDSGSDQRHHFQTFSIVSPNSQGEIDLQVWYRSGNTGNQARMYESEMVLFRIM